MRSILIVLLLAIMQLPALLVALPAPVLVQAPLLAWARVQQLPPREACWLREPAMPRWRSCSWGHSSRKAQTSLTVLLAVLPVSVMAWAPLQAWARVQQLPPQEASWLRAPAMPRWHSCS